MKTPPAYWNKAKRILSKRDPILRKIIKKFNKGFLTTRKDPFFSYVVQLLDNKYLQKQQIQYGQNLRLNVKKKLFQAMY